MEVTSDPCLRRSKEDASWRSSALKFEDEKLMAETASTYDSHDPLLHGADGTRAHSKIKDRARSMQSMKQGYDVDEL